MKNKLAILRTEKGTTFVEVMLAVALLAIIVVPLVYSVSSTVNNNITAKEKTEAIALADMAIDNIKAQKVITTTTSAIYLGASSSTLETYYTIKSEGTSKVTQNTTQTQFTYDTEIRQKTDFELVVDQTNLNNGEFDITVNAVKDSDGSTVSTKMSHISVNDILNLYLYDDKYSLMIGGTAIHIDGSIAQVEPDKISIRVTYTGDVTDKKPIKIYAYDYSNINTKLDIYLVDSSEHKPGVIFINKRADKNFNLAYIDSNNFDYNDSINELFKITVTVKRKSDEAEVYTVSSYVKK